MAKQVMRWQCEICGEVFETRELAEQCEAKGKEKESVKYPVGAVVGAYSEEVVVYCDPGPNKTARVLKAYKIVEIRESGHGILYKLQNPYRDWDCLLVTKDEIQPLPPLPVVIAPLSEEDGGGWLAEIMNFPGCMSDGETPAEALKNVLDAKEAWLEVAHEHGQKIPAVSESKVAVEVPVLNVSMEGNISSALGELEKIYSNLTKKC